MTAKILAHCEPLTEALKAYGIDPMNTPQQCTFEWAPTGILIDQYVTQSEQPGDTALHDRIPGDETEPRPLTVKRFFPHPKPTEPWTTIPERQLD